ncbi:insulin-like growth factor-binding protein 1 isoform X2 [Xyrauchen texanus]|uniref:insulin-like growth factor-binding protein 1 isoform X2 n=1 Tax=Xyrauchen texanus TaxID=154827 RepID=UPI0022422A4F|nr:insulin-like growth factor-binding protein 1 isoform X2 [Xyrauchen texanus]
MRGLCLSVMFVSIFWPAELTPVVGPEPIRCAPCSQDQLSACPVVSSDCQEVLREPGCGCCFACALKKDDTDITSEQGSLNYLLGLNRPLNPQDAAEAQESIKAKVNAIRKKLVQQGPCHTELHASLDIITESQQILGEKFTNFYLPNCDKHGFYKAKQCETSLIGHPPRCWCVSSWNGKRIPGSDDLTGDAQCHQEVTH